MYGAAGRPVISVDTKKKDLIGNFKNAGRTWEQEPTKVKDHDFPSEADGKTLPYGIYDITHNQGHVYVGTSYDTPTLLYNYIQDTVTETGLTVKAFLVDLIFEKRLQYDQKECENLNLQRCRTCPTWNYTIKPHACYG